MSVRGTPDAIERQAIAAAEFLHEIGERKLGNDVLALARSARSARGTARTLARDVQALRQNGVWCVFCEMVVKHDEAKACKKAGCKARGQAR